MKNLFKTIATALTFGCLLTGLTSCDKPTAPPRVDEGDVITGVITSDLTLDPTKVYILKRFAYVQAPATLTIPAGTVIKGDKDTKGTLIIERGAKIIADGTEDKPIVFTSNQAAGFRSYGDWGGIIILGNAPQNQPGVPLIEGGVDRPYGGTDPNDNSGILRYVRIEFGGIALNPNNEINGLTLGGVGAGTIIDYVQVSYCGDDAIEWFGGTVNAKHLIMHRTWDDDFDSDNGFSGKVQYAVALRDPAITDQSTSNGFESDNDATGSLLTPQTKAVYSNISVFGHFHTLADSAGASSLVGRGAHIRRNSSISIFNSVITGYREGIRLDATTTQGNMTAGELVLKNITLAGNLKALNVANEAVLSTFSDEFYSSSNNNNQLNTIAELKLNSNVFNLDAPNFLPNNDSPLLNSADYSHAKLQGGFFTTTSNFRGAFGSVDWTAKWAAFNPQTIEY